MNFFSRIRANHSRNEIPTFIVDKVKHCIAKFLAVMETVDISGLIINLDLTDRKIFNKAIKKQQTGKVISCRYVPSPTGQQKENRPLPCTRPMRSPTLVTQQKQAG